MYASHARGISQLPTKLYEEFQLVYRQQDQSLAKLVPVNDCFSRNTYHLIPKMGYRCHSRVLSPKPAIQLEFRSLSYLDGSYALIVRGQ